MLQTHKPKISNVVLGRNPGKENTSTLCGNCVCMPNPGCLLLQKYTTVSDFDLGTLGEKGLLCLNSFKGNRIQKTTHAIHLPSSMDFLKCHSL